MTFEKRFCTELRATDEGKLSGYAAVFNSPSHDLGGFREIILPGAFDRTLEEFPDVLALVEHDTGKVLGRTTNGTLTIRPDDHGLYVEIDPANTSYARDLLELVRRGDVAGMSFRFKPYPGGARMDMSTAPPTRYLSSIQLKEVSVVVDPAYPATEVSVRALEEARTANLTHTLRRMRLRLAEIS
ncbi:MAG TPA: HK97 family phage prohead protease [Longimicrobiales bacterium]